ncbi:CBS domain containing protein [Acanthamoeba castellanii str. Neff]|uniref:CBS domain containing protein n=1 Tax=Acanthamoeba castellanii (strain ATCC 30010 / Neff) TaxID=1257118 RepID=L8GFG0_ACACF|nr:CBS domain containing protein [Acanthamoeba castellanii str. Neff]ELR10921.1 CBS domain containing protein [Acanthamoeba castellanii str. Neff]
MEGNTSLKRKEGHEADAAKAQGTPATSAASEQPPKHKKARTEEENTERGDEPSEQALVGELKEALAKGTAQDVIYWMKDGTIIQLLATDSFYVALATLVDAKIRAAPIYDPAEQKYVGFVDMLDLTAAIVELLEVNETFKNKKNKKEKKEKETKQEEEESEEVKRRKRDYAEDEEDPFAEHLMLESLSVKAISDFSHTDPFISVRSDESLTKVAELLRTHHRIGVVNEKGTFIGFVEYLSEEHALTLDKTGLTVGDLGLARHHVHTVPVEGTTALDALKEMRDRKVTGLGVVNKNGVLLDVISASDLMVWAEWEACGQPIRFRHLSTLNYPITEFLAQSRAQAHHKKVNRNEGPMVCTSETELQEAIGTMLVNNIHRLFVVDEARKPVSVLTYGDIIARLTA